MDVENGQWFPVGTISESIFFTSLPVANCCQWIHYNIGHVTVDTSLVYPMKARAQRI